VRRAAGALRLSPAINQRGQTARMRCERSSARRPPRRTGWPSCAIRAMGLVMGRASGASDSAGDMHDWR